MNWDPPDNWFVMENWFNGVYYDGAGVRRPVVIFIEFSTTVSGLVSVTRTYCRSSGRAIATSVLSEMWVAPVEAQLITPACARTSSSGERLRVEGALWGSRDSPWRDLGAVANSSPGVSSPIVGL